MEDIILKELQELKKATVLSAKQALTMNDVSILSGLSKSHLYKLVCTRQIPHYKSGGKITYFDKNEVTNWLLKTKIKTTDELETEAAEYVVNNNKGKRGGVNG